MKHTSNSIRWVKHNVFTKNSNKISLKGDDGKRVILDDYIHTLPYRHYKLDPSTEPPLKRIKKNNSTVDAR